MKIAYLSTFYPFRGGIAQFNAALYRVFEQSHDIKAFTFFRQYPEMLFPGKSQYVDPKDDSVDKITSEKVLDTLNPVGYHRAAKKIEQYKPDLMITKYWMPYFAPSFGWIAKQLKKRDCINISILDNVIPHEKRPGDIKLTKFYLKQNHGFIAMTNAVKDDLLSLKEDAKVVVQPHPLYNHFGEQIHPADARKKLGLSTDSRILLFFGFIRDYKGLDILIDTMKKLPEDYQLIIAGESYGSFDKYDKQIKKLGLENRITKMVRYISDDEVPAIFSAADLCVLPYKSATQSGIIGISYHFDLPVISTDVGGLREMIDEYETGIVVEKPDAELIKNAIEKYFTSSLRERFESNIQSYKRKANWWAMAEAILDLKEKIDKEK